MPRRTSPLYPFPARRCVHCVRNRCVLSLERDPAYHEKWRCLVVSSWDRALEESMDRADAFGLDQERSVKHCMESLDRQAGTEACARFSPAEKASEKNALGCRHLWKDTCLLLAPLCPGACPRFTLDAAWEAHPGFRP